MINHLVVKDLPPNYEAIKLAFPSVDPSKTVFTYGDTTYNPGGCNMPDH